MKVAGDVLEHVTSLSRSPFWEMTMIDFNDSEQFRELKEYPGYGVGRDGTAWSRRKMGPTGELGSTWKQLKPIVNRVNGYKYISPCVNGKNSPTTLHGLVVTAFVGPSPFIGAVCRHLDGNKSNNTASNLAWGTCVDNAEDARQHGTLAVGNRLPQAKLTAELVIHFRELYSTGRYLQREIAAMFGFSRESVRNAINGTTWKHIPRSES